MYFVNINNDYILKDSVMCCFSLYLWVYISEFLCNYKFFLMIKCCCSKNINIYLCYILCAYVYENYGFWYSLVRSEEKFYIRVV